MKTKIHKNYSEFINRKDRKENGVSESFAKNNPNFEDDNKTNISCWNCSRCSRCSGCSYCSCCSDCSRCNGNASAAAFRSSRDKKDGDYIAKLICSSDESDMLAEFELLERGCNG